MFWHQSLEISYFWLRIQDSRRFQLAIYTVFHEESESAVRIDQILHPEEKIKKNRPMRVSISYRKISYHTSPPYFRDVSRKLLEQFWEMARACPGENRRQIIVWS